jgi:transglutaminase-like putative cysteine protease
MTRPPARPLRREILNRLLPTLAVITAPQFTRLPLWLTAAAVLFGGGCFLINARRMAAPGMVLRTLLSLLLPLAVLNHYGTLLGRDAGTALLVAMLALKLLEINTARDLYVVVFLGYFLIAVGFLYTQSLAMAAYMLIGAALLTTVMIDLNRVNTAPAADNLRLAAALLLRALPLALLLFILFPRLQGPLWDLPKDAYGGISGLSDEMAPGLLSDLSASDEVAFRVRFQGEPPPPGQRYWRGPVLWDTDGTRWHGGSPGGPRHQAPPLIRAGPAVTYTVTQEPSNRRWLFALDLAGAIPADAAIDDDFVLQSRRPLRARRSYTVTSYPEATAASLTALQRTRALRLPRDGNPRARALAQEWRARYHDPAAIVRQALGLFHDGPFVYTLHPPLIAGDFVDGFLFGTRRGFCEHYAAAFVFLMRAAGVPARVVTGYQGGVLNPFGRYLIVRQRDAHAWAEVWFDGQGWRRVDPTAAVAPERIEYGIDAGTETEGAVRFAAAAGWLPSLWQEAGYGLDALDNKWNQWVLRYDAGRQARLLQGLQFGALHWQTTAVLLAAVLGAALLGLTLQGIQRTRPPNDPVQRTYGRFCAKLARRGLMRLGHEGPETFAARAGADRPDLAPAIHVITRLYLALRYGGHRPAPALNQLRRAVRRFRA